MTKEVPIILCWGYEFNFENKKLQEVEEYLVDELQAISLNKSPNEYSLEKRYDTPGRIINYHIKFIFDKEGFLDALDTAGAIVAYVGHSRYGQGPIFGEIEPKSPVDECWGNFFRMGWDLIEVPCIQDIIMHSTKPKEYDGESKFQFIDSKMNKGPVKYKKSENCKNKTSKRVLKKCDPVVANIFNGKNEKTIFERHYWGFWPFDKAGKQWVEHYFVQNSIKGEFMPKVDYKTIVESGNSDLRKSSLKCKVLYMGSCSSFRHFYCALKKHKEDKKQSKTVFYLTKDLSYGGLSNSSKIMLKNIIEYEVDITTVEGSKRFIEEVNADDRRIKIADKDNPSFASGKLVFYDGTEKNVKKCPTWSK